MTVLRRQRWIAGILAAVLLCASLWGGPVGVLCVGDCGSVLPMAASDTSEPGASTHQTSCCCTDEDAPPAEPPTDEGGQPECCIEIGVEPTADDGGATSRHDVATAPPAPAPSPAMGAATPTAPPERIVEEPPRVAAGLVRLATVVLRI